MAAAQRTPLDTVQGPHLQGQIVVTVTIAPDGHLIALALLRGAQNKALVTAVETVIRHAAPFAPLPRFWQANQLPLQIARTWNFSVQDSLTDGPH